MNSGRIPLPTCAMCLEPGADVIRYELRNPRTGETSPIMCDDACAEVIERMGWTLTTKELRYVAA